MKKKILFGSLALIVLIAGFVAWKFFGQRVHQPEKKYFYISTGETFQSVRQHLLDSNIIHGTKWYNLAAKAIGFETVRPGRYEITRGMNITNLVRMLKNGRQSPVNFVVTKIRTKETLAARLGNSFELDSAEVIAYLNNIDTLQRYGLDTNTVMAAVMPLTYTLNWNTPMNRIFSQFYNAFTEFWNDDRKSKAAKLGLKPVEVSTLASIIDEETNSKTDKPNVASVYINRIAKGMPLQADPTIKFAMRNFALKRIYTNYTRFASPYNTYINKGLPPGPICTPAIETLEAVLDAPSTDYIYFVASPAFDGTHVFTSNYEDHMKQAKLYQAELNKRNIR